MVGWDRSASARMICSTDLWSGGPFSCGAGVVGCPCSGHNRLRISCDWQEAPEFCGSHAFPDISAAFMSAVRSPVSADPPALLATTA